MSNENTPSGNPAPGKGTEKDSGEKVDRRTLGTRVGRFLAYTAPALIALTTAQQAHAS
jgi:hypothetical protein